MIGDVQRDPLIEQFAPALARIMRIAGLEQQDRDFWRAAIEREAWRAFISRRVNVTEHAPGAHWMDAFATRIREEADEADAFVARVRKRAEELR